MRISLISLSLAPLCEKVETSRGVKPQSFKAFTSTTPDFTACPRSRKLSTCNSFHLYFTLIDFQTLRYYIPVMIK
ncbi:hypothetical protein BT93_E1982 [Corymbia citriodora subsp. variegata]|nr:hypothetical protein BT93_E1277 [Corymbia citriodora subsp. variegata]KAF8029440.1 hypothetical protein BT93_E1982 [Corymbia citriodora subsp. variegata]